MAKENIQPVGHRILVQLVESTEQVVGGIVLPDTITKERPNAAKVIAVGSGFVGENGRIPLPIDIKEGDKVLLSKHAGVEVKINDVKHFIITPEDVLGIFY